MKRIWRLARFCTVLVWYAGKMTLSGRGLSDSKRLSHIASLQRDGGQLICRILGVTVSANGLTRIDKPFLIVSNHVGLLDSWVLSSQFSVAFAAKIEMAMWPVFAWIGKSAGLIYVDRESRMSTTSFVETVRERMRNGVAVLVFPEGTTHADTHLLPFKTGGFAAVSGMSDGFVLPVYIWATKIDGSNTTASTRSEVAWSPSESMWQNAWKIVGFKSIEIEIVVGELISTDGLDRKELARLSQDQVEDLQRSTMNWGNLMDDSSSTIL